MAANLDSGVQLVAVGNVVASAQFLLAHYPVVIRGGGQCYLCYFINSNFFPKKCSAFVLDKLM